MTLTCSNCQARLQLDDAKAPTGRFTVRCPKCQTAIKVGTTSPSGESMMTDPAMQSSSGFTRPIAAARFNPDGKDVGSAVDSESAAPEMTDLVQFLADALRGVDGGSPVAR